ncbi:hypothetical protein JCM8115_003710 [Rhodotorula mucilaginosa]
MPPVQSRLLALPQPPASCADILRRLEPLPDEVGEFPTDVSYLPAHVVKFAGKDILPIELISTLTKSKAYINHRLARAIRSCVGIDDLTRAGGNNRTWYTSVQRRKFYEKNPPDQQSTALTALFEAENASELTNKRRTLLQLMVEQFEDNNHVSFNDIKNHIKHTPSRPQEQSAPERWAELLIELSSFYSWMRDHGRHAHVWLLLASPTGEQITSFQHKQTTYVFKKDHKNNTLNIDKPRFKRLMHVLAKTAKEVKKEEEQKLVQLVEHASLSAGVILAKDDRATQRPAELRPLLAAAAGRVNGVVKELRLQSGYHVAFSSAEIKAVVKFLACRSCSLSTRQAAGYNLSLIWRDDLIKNAGFIEDGEAPTGWFHPSTAGDKDEDEEMADKCNNNNKKEDEDEEMMGGKEEKEEEEENPFEGLLTLDGMLEDEDFDELDDELNPDDDDEEEEE